MAEPLPSPDPWAEMVETILDSVYVRADDGELWAECNYCSIGDFDWSGTSYLEWTGLAVKHFLTYHRDKLPKLHTLLDPEAHAAIRTLDHDLKQAHVEDHIVDGTALNVLLTELGVEW